jgi:peroxiredoxin
MRLTPPCHSIPFSTHDIYGESLSLSHLHGRRVMLSFFRDAACPFCNFRIYELTHNYKEWQAAGLEIVVVFSSTAEEVRQHVARYPRPFRMVADPDLQLYEQYGIEQSTSALFKALMFKLPRIALGIYTGGRPKKNPHVNIVPADFLLDVDGSIVDTWYGRDTADHIPLERIQRFANDLLAGLSVKQKKELMYLRAENKRLRIENQSLKGTWKVYS